MVRKFLATLTLAAAVAAANAQSLTLSRTYKVGDKDTYITTMNMTGARAMEMTMTMVYEVTKVLDDGGAEMKVSLTDMKLNRDGQDITLPAAATSQFAFTEIYSKYGFPTEVKGSSANPMAASPTIGSQFLAGGLSIGKDVPIDYTDKQGVHVKGVVTLVDNAGGVAHVHYVGDTENPKDHSTIHVDGTYSIDTTSGKMVKTDMKIHLSRNGGTDMEMTSTLKTS